MNQADTMFSSSRYQRAELLSVPFPAEGRAFLDEDVLLYRLLTEAQRSKLEDASRIFIAEKSWEGCAGFQITDDVKLTIASQACLLVLGFEDYYFDELQTVLVYPGGFLAPTPAALEEETKLEARLGEAHWRGPVILSWWQSHWDARRLGRSNLVLHEFAHKLAELGDAHAGMPPLEDDDLAKRWETVIRPEYERLAEDAAYRRPSLLRHYGAENRAEFFAVASECFFLQPTALRQRHPELYQLLAACYRQDPATRPINQALTRRARDAEEEYSRHVIAEYSVAIRRQPDYIDGYAQRASWYCSLGDFENAVKDYTVVIQLAPRQERASAYYERGSVHLAAGSYDLAIADFNQSIRRAPDFAQAYRDRGAAWAAKEEVDAALADLTRALRLDPKDDSAYVERALVYHDCKKYDKALRDLTRAIGLSPYDPDAYSNRAWVHLAKGELDRAIADCQRALRIEPDFPEAHKHRGVAYLHKGKYNRALADLDEAIRLAPDYAEAYRSRAEAFSGKGEEEKARQDREQATKLDDKDKGRV
jgi:Mlc titration factor MtfA (ptsG expression regulator)/Tfp pilus assembly protein PilF